MRRSLSGRVPGGDLVAYHADRSAPFGVESLACGVRGVSHSICRAPRSRATATRPRSRTSHATAAHAGVHEQVVTAARCRGMDVSCA